MGDCASFEHAFSHTVPQFFWSTYFYKYVCLVLLVMNWKMGIALLWVAPVAFAIVLLSRKWQELLAKKYMTTRIDLSEGIQECLETVQDIKACNQEKTYLEKLDAKLDAAEKRRFPVNGQCESSYNRSDGLTAWTGNGYCCGKFADFKGKN